MSTEDILWSGWLQKKGGDAGGMVNRLSFMGISTNRDRYFVLSRRTITYYAPPGQSTRGSLFVQSPSHKALTELGFTKKGTIELDDIVSMKKNEEDNSLSLLSNSGRTYEFIGFEDNASSLDLSAFEGCLRNLGIKVEVDLDTIYEEKDDNFQGGSGLSAAALAAAEGAGKKPALAVPGSATPILSAVAGAAASAPTTPTPTSPAPAATPPPAPLTGKDLLKRPQNAQTHDDHMSDMVSNREKTIDEMKIQTMYKMVDDVEVSAGGRKLDKKVLYLTNKQCNMFDELALSRCLQALDLGKPKCVIRLLSAEKGVAQYSVHTESRGYVLSPQQYGCDLDAHDSARSQMQLDLFMKTCILPLAKQTHALIICSGCNDDALAASLERVVVPEQARLGKNCPFKVLTFVWSFEVHYKAFLNEGIAGQVAAECSAWSLRLDAISQFMAGYEDRNLQRCDLIQSASHVIVFETFEDGKVQPAASKAFQAKLMDAMTMKLPSIAIQILACDYVMTSDLSRRGIPILFLDTRERAITTKVLNPTAARTPMTHLAKMTKAFPTIAADRIAKFSKNPDGTITLAAKRELLHLAFSMIDSCVDVLGDQCLVDYDNASAIALVHAALLFGTDTTDADSSCVPLYARIAELKRAELDSGTSSGNTRALIPLELAKEAAQYLNSKMRTGVTRAKLRQVKKWLEANKPGGKFDSNRGLASRWETYLQNNLTFAENNEGEYQTDTDATSFLSILDIITNQHTFSGSVFDLEDINRTISSVVRIDRLPKNNSMEALLSLQDAWDHVDSYHQMANFYKVVTKMSYALLLLAGIATSIIAITKEDVDSSEAADGSSSGSSSSQWVILALSLLVTTVVGYVNFMNPAQRWQQLRGAAMNMESQIWMFRTRSGDYRKSIENDADSGAADQMLAEQIQSIKDAVLEGADIKTSSFFGKVGSPNLHAQHVPTYRQIQESKNKGCWKSFCKSIDPNEALDAPVESTPNTAQTGAVGGKTALPVGHAPTPPAPHNKGLTAAQGRAAREQRGPHSPVSTTSDDEVDATSLHVPTLPIVEGGTSIDALLAWLGTRFVSTSDSAGPKDSHYLPVLPNNYVQFRIEKALRFYKKRIPLCNRTRHVCQLLSTAGSLAGVVLAFLNKVEYTVITAIGTTGVMAWLEFQGTNNKIERYSSVVDALQKHIIWWKTRPPIEKSATENIDHLVVTCEEILRDEMNAWRSSSASQSKMLEKAAADSGAKGGGEV